MKLKEILLELSFKYLYRFTPHKFRERADHVRVRLLTRTKNDKYIYKSVSDNGNVHKQMVKPLLSKKLENIDQDVVVWCDCENFQYENEVVLWKSDASHKINSNGKWPIIRNPRRVKKLCKHLVAVFEDIKKRI